MKKYNLIIAPDRNTRGGITSVVKAHKQTKMWKKWNCIWIETYNDKHFLNKIIFFIRSLFLYTIRLKNAQIIHIHFSGPTSAHRKFAYLRLAKIFNKKIVVHLHVFSPETSFLGKSSKLYFKIFNEADKIIALSNTWKNEIIKFYPIYDKIEVIYNPCPQVRNIEKQFESKQIIYAGALNKRKGYADLIKAFGLIASNFPEWKLILAGNGEMQEGKLLVKNLDIENQVVFKGWISGKEKEQLFQNASIFCLPSYAEGFPMAVLDAWAYGLPVITTAVGGLPDILKHKENAMVFIPGNIEELKSNLQELILDESLRKSLGKKSFELSTNKFNINTIGEQLDMLYTKLTINE